MESTYRVAFKFLGSKKSELVKSLLTIAKRGGLFVSAAQAKFIWHECSSYRDATAKAWGQEYVDGNPNAFACLLMDKDERFGILDKSKTRYYAYYFVPNQMH